VLYTLRMEPDQIRKQLILRAAKRRDLIQKTNAQTQAIRDLACQAVKAGVPKKEVAGIAQISRPTLDAWLRE
jgi:hypothetical protein